MAKYRITPSSKAIMQLPISIGHKAEKGVEAIEFDLTAWVEAYGSGTATIIMRRWGDAIPYPIALEIDENNKTTWTLSDTDTAKAGMAYAQLSYIVGDEVVKKSDIYTFRVMDSLTGEGEPPEAYESWLEHLTHFAAEAMAEVLDIEGIVTDKTLTVDGGIADAKATGDALSALEDQFSEETGKLKADLNESLSYIGAYNFIWEQGRFSATGTNVNDSTRIRTIDYIPVTAGETFVVSVPDSTRVYFYAWNIDGSFNSYTADGSLRNGDTYTIPNGVDKIKIVTANIDFSEITTDYGANVTIYRTDSALFKAFDSPLKADKSTTYTKTEVDTLIDESLDSVSESLGAVGESAKVTITSDEWVKGRINDSGTEASSAYTIRSGSHLITPNTYIKFDGAFRGPTNVVRLIQGYFYKADGSYIDKCSVSRSQPIFVIPDESAYVRFCYGHTMSTEIMVDDIGLETLAADFSVLSYSALAYDINKSLSYTGVYKLTWEQGRFNTSGTPITATGRIRTINYTPVTAGETFVVSVPDSTRVYFYAWNIDGSFNSYTADGSLRNGDTYTVPDGVDKIKLVVAANPDFSEITPDYGANVAIYRTDSALIKTINNPLKGYAGAMLTIIDDDCYKRFYTDLYTIVRTRNVPVSAAIITGFVGDGSHMTWEQIQECSANGIEILAHSNRHFLSTDSDFNTITTDEIAKDYLIAKNQLALHGVPSDILVFSGSTGLHDKFQQACKRVYKAGILAGDNVTNYQGANPYAIKRYRIGNNTDYACDFTVLKGLIDNLNKYGGWMIWMTHTSGGANSWTPGTDEGSSAYIIGQAIDYAISLGVPIVTAEYGVQKYFGT